MSTALDLRVVPDADAAASVAAEVLATLIIEAVDARGRAVIAVSGGATPWLMLGDLATRDVPWGELHVFQVDERVALDGDPDRNDTHLRESLFDRVPIPADQIHPMDVCAPDLGAAATAYGELLSDVAGGVLDVVHLGLGDDGHTASLAPGGAALDEHERLVVPTEDAFRGHRRMTLTLPALDAARRRLWLVTGAMKSAMLARLVAGDEAIPAGRVRRDETTIVCDREAAEGVNHG